MRDWHDFYDYSKEEILDCEQFVAGYMLFLRILA